MEVFTHAGLQMLILFTLVALGFVARKRHMMNYDFDSQVTSVVMNIALPGMIIDSVLSNQNLPDTSTILMLLLYSFLIYVGICIFALIITRVLYWRVPKATKGAFEFLICFGNVGFIGFPVLSAIVGPDAVLYAAILNIPYNLFMFSVGVLFIKNAGQSDAPAAEHSLKTQVKLILKQMVNPCMISCIVAVILAILRVTDDGYFGQTFGLIGQFTVPAAMLLTGSQLAKMPLKEMFNDPWSWVTTALRLFVVPLLVFFIAGMFVHDSYMLSILALQAAMPAASLGIMMSIAYGGDTMAMSRGTFLTTVCALISLPVVSMIVVV